jgi:hypothetical protein
VIPLGGDDGALPPELRRRVRDAAREELRRAPVATPWPRQAAWAVAALLAFSALALVVSVLAGIGPGARLGEKAALLGVLLGAQAIGVWSIAAPLSRRRLGAAVASALAAGLAVALARAGSSGFAGSAPDWLCSISHLAVDVVPAAVTLWLLRGGAWHPLRAVAAGLAAGTVGLLVGEIGCERGLAHVLVYHLGFWLLAAAVFAVATRRSRPRSFAP